MRLATLLLLALIPGISAAQTPTAPSQQPDSSPRQRGERRGPGVAGTITAISADSLTLKTFDGGTATVKLTGDTRFRKDQQEA